MSYYTSQTGRACKRPPGYQAPPDTLQQDDEYNTCACAIRKGKPPVFSKQAMTHLPEPSPDVYMRARAVARERGVATPPAKRRIIMEYVDDSDDNNNDGFDIKGSDYTEPYNYFGQLSACREKRDGLLEQRDSIAEQLDSVHKEIQSYEDSIAEGYSPRKKKTSIFESLFILT